jgi:hypothetical protein
MVYFKDVGLSRFDGVCDDVLKRRLLFPSHIRESFRFL